jgi:guanylate kinase
MRDPIRRRRGFMLVLSSPSGAGKTTLSRRVLEQNSDFVMSVSATTRAPRQGEVHGKDYYFVSPEEFEGMVQRSEFFEHATVFSHRYGSPHDPVMKALDTGKSVLFDIDWQGTQAISQRARDDLVTVFILPPSMDDLAKRLKSRAQDSAEVVAARMAKAEGEISHWSEYDYVLVNDDVDACARALQHIIESERLKRERQVWLLDFVRNLTGQKG